MGGVRTFTKADERFRGRRVACGDAASVRVAGFDGLARRCTLWVYCGENFLGVARISESSDGNVRVVGDGKVGRAVGKNAALDFGDQLDAFNVVPAFEWNALHHVQRFDHIDTTGSG